MNLQRALTVVAFHNFERGDEEGQGTEIRRIVSNLFKKQMPASPSLFPTVLSATWQMGNLKCIFLGKTKCLWGNGQPGTLKVEGGIKWDLGLECWEPLLSSPLLASQMEAFTFHTGNGKNLLWRIWPTQEEKPKGKGTVHKYLYSSW